MMMMMMMTVTNENCTVMQSLFCAYARLYLNMFTLKYTKSLHYAVELLGTAEIDGVGSMFETLRVSSTVYKSLK